MAPSSASAHEAAKPRQPTPAQPLHPSLPLFRGEGPRRTAEVRIKDAEASNGLSLSRAITAAGELVNEQNELITEGVEKGKYRATMVVRDEL